jgi:GMP synthase-like glutamine amidotransferase
MKSALVLQHMDHDHPGRFLDYFSEDGIIPEFVRVFEGAAIPSLADYDLMFVLGGAQDTWETDKYPYLVAEQEAIREWVWDRAKPYLGVCLGHQLLATSLGGEVARAEESEVGVFDVMLTEDGMSHPFLAGLSGQHRVMQWHFAEVKRAPQGAKVLAQSSRTSAQAIAIDGHAIGTQFHCEFSAQTVAGWSSLPKYIEALERVHGVGAYNRLLRECYPLMPEMERMTRQMWRNFAWTSGLLRRS